ncbi:MAG TPA: MerR family transcriptional regulator [Candidatus Limnocylindrales bacterium]|nr:MerR family transcriptional regulator [Candidatus Limnocylindrales bacterium]
MANDASYTISDLAGLTGLSVRTIRYYLAQGLIPASGESGPGAHYGEGHLARLRLVRRLQQQHLPLAEIRARLASLRDDEATSLAAASDVVTEPATSALDYVRSVIAGSNRTPVPPQPSPVPPVAAPAQAMPPPAMPAMRDAPVVGRSLRRIDLPFTTRLSTAAADPDLPAAPPVAAAALAAAQAAPQAATSPSIERSQWERLSLGPNLELHVRRPLGRLEQKRVERLITIARQVLKEEQP